MTRAELEEAVDNGEYDDAYWAFVAKQMDGRCWEDAIYAEIEAATYFDDFVDHLLDTLQ